MSDETLNRHLFYVKFTDNFTHWIKLKFSHTRYQALGPELIPVYRQSVRR